jgi:AcrR family transcriptional regulator
MGRPRVHDERTAAKLIDAAERIVEAEGLDTLSVRRVARETGTSTRAVYSLFSSKDGLVIALGTRAFEFLGSAAAALPRSDDPQRDLVSAGLMFRSFAREHPALFRIGVQRIDVPPELGREFAAAANSALNELRALVGRLCETGGLGGRPVERATLQFHALCEGLAAVDARCLAVGLVTDGIWEDAISSLIRGWGTGGLAHGVASPDQP